MYFYGLASFTQNNDFEIHEYCCIYQEFIPFYYRVAFYSMIQHNLFIHSSVDGHLGCFNFGLLKGKLKAAIFKAPSLRHCLI